MIKMEIHLDEEKIIADDEYEPSVIYEAVDQVFKDCKLIKGENGFYYGNDDDKDFSRFGAAIGILDEMEWFMCYVDI